MGLSEIRQPKPTDSIVAQLANTAVWSHVEQQCYLRKSRDSWSESKIYFASKIFPREIPEKFRDIQFSLILVGLYGFI